MKCLTDYLNENKGTFNLLLQFGMDFRSGFDFWKFTSRITDPVETIGIGVHNAARFARCIKLPRAVYIYIYISL
jgi:hypothetical protein